MLLKAGFKCQCQELKDADHFEIMWNLSDEDNDGTKVSYQVGLNEV